MRKINIVDGIEQVLAYTPSAGSDDNVTGWACGAIPTAKKEDPQQAFEAAPVEYKNKPPVLITYLFTIIHPHYFGSGV